MNNFIIFMDYKKYQELEKYINKIANDDTFKAISNLEDDWNILTYTSKNELFEDLEI